MSIEIDVKVELKDALKALTPQCVERLLSASLVAGGLLIANRWKELAPYRTGTYRRSIHVGGHTSLTPDFDPSGDSKRYSDMGQPESPLRVVVGTNITDPPYPVFLEYGTRKMAPRPSMRPAVDETRQQAIDEIGDTFKELLEKTLK